MMRYVKITCVELGALPARHDRRKVSPFTREYSQNAEIMSD